MKLLVNEFLAQATAQPDKPAVMDCYGTDTYGVLNRRSAIVAARLLDMSQNPNTGMRVGVLLPRNRAYLTAVLGILRSGGAVVPLEEDYPAERVHSVLRDAGCVACISIEQLSGKVADIPVLTLEDIFADEDTLAVDETINLSAPDKEGLILFTSGSTGKPKGVVHRHTFFSMWLYTVKGYHEFSGKDVTCCMAGMTFIASFVDLYPPLMVGGSVYIASSTERMNADMLYKIIQKRHITGMFLPPQMFYVMRELYGRLPLDYVVLGGEKAKAKYTMDGNIHEVYGSSECAAILLHKIAQEDSRMLGKPGNGVSVYLVSDDGKLIQEPGVLGELCVESPWLALRYNNMPEETAAKFTDNPFGAGRLFHTGDYMAYDEEGNLLFHGRKDHMVKLRGYRVELGEVELTVQKANGVQEAACVTIRVHGGDKLACYYIGDQVDSNVLRNHVKDILPEYMVPDYFVYLADMPRNERNKVDYLALKNMEPPVEEEEYEPPQNDLEAKICAAFAEVLELPRVSALADFFNMGGTSLSVAMLVAQLDDTTLSFNDIASYPTPRALAAYLEENAKNHREKPVMNREFYPLTKTQMGIYLEGLTGGNTSTYTLSYLMVADAKVTADQLVRAVKDVVDAHPSMKYVIRAGKDGIPHMYMVPDAVFEVPVIDGSEEQRLDFIREYMPVVPMINELLFYFAVYRTAERCYLALKSHLIFFDATSLSLLISELNRVLGSSSGRVEYLQEEYTIQQVGMYEEALMQEGAHEKAEAYFQNLFAKMDEVPSLVGDREGPLTPGVSENMRYIPKNLTVEQVKAFCNRHQISEGSFFMGAMALLLSKYLSSKQVSFSSVYNGRAQAGMDITIGTLIKRIPVCGDFTENMPVVDYLRNMGRQIVTSMGNDIYSFDEVLKHCPVNEDVEFIYQGDLFTDNMGGGNNDEGGNLICGDSYFLEHYHTGMVTGCFSIQFFSTNGLYNMTIEYRNERFSPAFVERFAQDLFTVAEGLLRQELIGDISLLTDDDKKSLAVFNDTQVIMDFVPVQEQIRQQAQMTPDKMAVTAAGHSLTFRELDELSDQVAHSLISEGVTLETLVGVLFDREVWAYVAEIGILKAGGAFVPFIPEYPDERIEYCLEDGNIPIMLTSTDLMNQRSALREQCKVLSLDKLLENKVADTDLPKVGADNLAYCIYTSGTTGKPKGVMIEHKNIANYVHCNEKSPEIMHYTKSGRVALALASFSFDVSIVEEFVPLCNGCSVVIATEEEIHTPNLLAQLIINTGVNGITCTPTYLLGLLAIPETVEALQQITFYDVGAEAFPAGLYQKLRALRQDSVILNVYGPTEATMGCAAEEMVESEVVTVGTPIANTQFYIADSFGNPLPIGIRGELMICGQQVGRGYINLPDKTAASFFDKDGIRAYRSGDLAAWTHDGKIRVFGRIDNQIKLRGFRIELDEIEKVLMEYPDINSGAVSVLKKGTGEYLVGYYTSVNAVDDNKLKNHLAAKLPEYMVPNLFVRLEAMPLTPNGKVNRRALPEPDLSAFRAKYEPPATEVERALCHAFALALNLPEDKVGALDDFFDLGGDSLSAMVALANADISGLIAADIFQKRTPRQIAVIAEERMNMGSFEEREMAARKQPLALTPLQIQMLDIQLFRPEATMWSNMHFLVRFELDEVDMHRLCKAVNRAIANHPALSSVFRFDENRELVQQYVPGILEEVELQDINEETVPMLPDVLVMPFDKILDACLCRVKVFRSPSHGYMFMDIHHLLMDGDSLGVLLADIVNAYFDRELQPDYYFALRSEEIQRIEQGSWNEDRAWFEAQYGDEVWCKVPDMSVESQELVDRKHIDQAAMEQRLAFSADDVKKAEKFWGVSHSVMAIGAALLTLSRFTGKQHVMVNWIYNDRLAAEAQHAVGMMIKNLPAAARMEEYASMSEFLISVKDQVAEGIAHSSYDFMAENFEPFVDDCMEVNLQLGINGDELDVFKPTLIELADEFAAAGAPLELELLENNYGDGGFDSEMEYAKGLFDAEQMRAFHDLYVKTLEGIVSCEEKL